MCRGVLEIIYLTGGVGEVGEHDDLLRGDYAGDIVVRGTYSLFWLLLYKCIGTGEARVEARVGVKRIGYIKWPLGWYRGIALEALLQVW